MPNVCEVCGESFKCNPNASHQKICNSCYEKLSEAIENPVYGICPVCGNYFTPTKSSNGKYDKTCSKECHHIFTILRQRISIAKRMGTYSMKRKLNKKKKKNRIDEINSQALAHGMSYGKYVAMMRMG